MSAIRVLVVEDEPLYADHLEMLLEKLGYQHQATVDNSNEALQQIEQQLPDLILMDVHIKGDYDGIELAEMILSKTLIPIIFITSMEDDLTFKRASRSKPLGFLVKPVKDIQLQRSIELAIRKLESQGSTPETYDDTLADEAFFIKNRQKLEKVWIKDLLYIEAEGRYTKLVKSDKKYLLRRPFQEVLDRLQSHNFTQTHRSFALNLKQVTSVDLEDYLIHLGEHHVPLSKRNKDDFIHKLKLL